MSVGVYFGRAAERSFCSPSWPGEHDVGVSSSYYPLRDEVLTRRETDRQSRPYKGKRSPAICQNVDRINHRSRAAKKERPQN